MLIPPQRVHTRELLDTPALVADELPANLRDLRRLNRWFGGTAVVRRHFAGVCARYQAPGAGGTTLTLLDVATGSGDIPSALARWARRRGIDLHITGLDSSREVLAEAAKESARRGADMDLVLGDARELPWNRGSFDVVTCALSLHHFEPEGAIALLRELRRVARRAVIVTDLRRSGPGYLATWLITRIASRSRLTRHDGPISVLRAYTVGEVASLARQAGLHDACVRPHRFFRLVLVSHCESDSDRAL